MSVLTVLLARYERQKQKYDRELKTLTDAINDELAKADLSPDDKARLKALGFALPKPASKSEAREATVKDGD